MTPWVGASPGAYCTALLSYAPSISAWQRVGLLVPASQLGEDSCVASGAASPLDTTGSRTILASMGCTPCSGAKGCFLRSDTVIGWVYASVRKMNLFKCSSHPLLTLMVKTQGLSVRPAPKNRCLFKKAVSEKLTMVLNNKRSLCVHRLRNCNKYTHLWKVLKC